MVEKLYDFTHCNNFSAQRQQFVFWRCDEYIHNGRWNCLIQKRQHIVMPMKISLLTHWIPNATHWTRNFSTTLHQITDRFICIFTKIIIKIKKQNRTEIIICGGLYERRTQPIRHEHEHEHTMKINIMQLHNALSQFAHCDFAPNCNFIHCAKFVKSHFYLIWRRPLRDT